MRTSEGRVADAYALEEGLAQALAMLAKKECQDAVLEAQA